MSLVGQERWRPSGPAPSPSQKVAARRDGADETRRGISTPPPGFREWRERDKEKKASGVGVETRRGAGGFASAKVDKTKVDETKVGAGRGEVSARRPGRQQGEGEGGRLGVGVHVGVRVSARERGCGLSKQECATVNEA